MAYIAVDLVMKYLAKNLDGYSLEDGPLKKKTELESRKLSKSSGSYAKS